MKYLFFDTEAASSKGSSKICEFGYVITNEHFDILAEENILINPNIESKDWDWYVVRKILTYKKKEYESEQIFTSYYEKIKDVLLSVNYIFGHSTINDVKSINDEIRRYGLEHINYDFFDIKKIYDGYAKAKGIGLNQILSNLQIEGDPNIHNAKVDAYNTMLSLKKMVNTLEITIDELITLLPDSKDSTENGVIDSSLNIIKRKKTRVEQLLAENKLLHDKQLNKLYLKYIARMNKRQLVDIDIFKGKRICISLNYEEAHLKEILLIIKTIASYGGKYTRKSSECDIFVVWEEENHADNIRRCSRHEYVIKAIENEKKIEIIQFQSFLDMLNITKKTLLECKIAEFDLYPIYENSMIKAQ